MSAAEPRCVQAERAPQRAIKMESGSTSLPCPPATCQRTAMLSGGGAAAAEAARLGKWRPRSLHVHSSLHLDLPPLFTLSNHPGSRGGHRGGGRRKLRQACSNAGQRRQVRALRAAAGAARLCRRGGRQQRQLRAIRGHLLLQGRHLALQLSDGRQVSWTRLPAQREQGTFKSCWPAMLV